MPCENCDCQFTIFKRKKSCYECKRFFCHICLERRNRSRYLCLRCVIFTKRPTRTELKKLKAKDLIFYLQSRHIPTAGCVEKDDLVNLVLAHMDTMTQRTNTSSNSSSSIPSPASQPFENVRSYFNNFTSSATPMPPPPPPQRPPPNQPSSASNSERQQQQQQSRQSSQDANTNFFGSASGESPFAFLRQGCQVIFDNVTDKLANNFKFEAPSRSSSSPSSATSPSSSTRPPGGGPSSTTNQRPSTGWDSGSNRRPSAPPPPPTVVVPPSQRPTTNRPKLRVPLDTLRHSESGCECSDDEESKQLRTTSQSTSNLLEDTVDPVLDLPGPSGSQIRNHDRATTTTATTRKSTGGGVPFSQSKGSTLTDSSEFSSFEELNAITVERKGPGRGASTEPEEERPIAPNGRSQFEERTFTPSNRLITRRRSDGSLNSKSLADAPTDCATTSKLKRKQSCKRCGRKKNELKRRLKRFHDQLTELSTQDGEIQQHLEAILLYLERRRISVLSNEDSNEETVSEQARPPTPVIVIEPFPEEFDDTPASTRWAGGGGSEEEDKQNVVYHGRFIKLDDIKSSADLEDLTVKQLKEILLLNRVDFKGCCEKKELIERVRRLLDDYHSCPSVEKLRGDDICKICMDAPIECVILECGHMATCTECGKQLSECPICRQYIVRVVRFFRA